MSSGFYFEISTGDGAKGEFPDALGPFQVASTTGISATDLKIEWGPAKTWAVQERNCLLPKSAIKGAGTQSILSVLPETLNITLSPLHPVNLAPAQRGGAGIPEKAEHFVWAYPIDTTTIPASAMATDDADTGFLTTGGFIYFDNSLKALQINALVAGSGGGLAFEKPKDWMPGWTESLASQGRKFHPVTLKALSDKGVSHFSWMSPNTIIGGALTEGGTAICPHGGFAYLKGAASTSAKPAQYECNNIILMTDGYKFSHHKQFPVSWLPPHCRPSGEANFLPPIVFPAKGSGTATKILSLRHVPRLPGDEASPYKVTIVTNVATAVQQIEKAEGTADFTYNGQPLTFTGQQKDRIVVEVSDAQCKMLKLPDAYKKFSFLNVDESKLKRGSNLNDGFEGGYNVSYFTPRAYSHVFSHLKDDNVVFFGLQYFIKQYLSGKIVTEDVITEADAFIARYMADVRVAGPGVDHEVGYDYTMFPRGDWESMMTGDFDGTGTAVGVPGALPVKIEALPEGSLASPGVCLFKITNTHPRFYWLPNFLETLLVQIWYPTSVATQAREFKKTIQAYSILSQRVSQMAPIFNLPGEFTLDNVVEDNLAIHVAQVFDLLDFGYRGVSSCETAGLGSGSYYTAGLEGSDTVAGSRFLLEYYNCNQNFTSIFEEAHGATSVPAAEHSTITSWADVSEAGDYQVYEAAEYNAFRNMIKQYMPSFAISLVSDGFNIWNAVTRLWPSVVVPADGGDSMRTMLTQRLEAFQLTLIRPDSGEGVETLPQLFTLLSQVLPEHFQADLSPLATVFPAGDAYEEKYKAVCDRIRANLGQSSGNPFRRFKGQQLRVLQGDGVALDTVGDMLASVLSNGFCANCVHFGSGGGLLQKLNRDSLAVAFKCCAMYVGDKCFPVGKDPIAGGKKSYGGNPPVIRGQDGVLRNRGEYDANGNMTKALAMSVEEFRNGCPGDEMVKVFENGSIIVDQTFKDITSRAKITKKALLPAMHQAVDNLALKMDFFQKMSSDEAIAIRIAEASCGSKWKHSHATHLPELKEKLPRYSATLDKLGITDAMSSIEVMDHIKANHVCDKKACKTVFRALTDGEPAAASAAMAGKCVVTL